MDFGFSEEQDSIRELAREILEKELTPERLKEVEATDDWFDEDLWGQLAEANLLGLAVPEALGGMGMGFAELCILLEELGRTTAPVPALATLVLGGLPIAAFGSETQQKEWLPRLAAGELILTAALLDAESGDRDVPATRSRREGNEVLLDGVKRLVPYAGRADLLLVPAAGEDDVGVFLLDPRAAGVELVGQVISTGEPLFELRLAGARVPADARLGGADADSAAIVRWLRERALVAVSALQVGVSSQALRSTAEYVREREQFGVPIGSFQAVQHRCADSFVDLEAMRWTTWRAAWRLARGLPAAREAAVAKFWAADGGSRIADAARHLHGGVGSDVDYPVHRYFLWSKSLELCLGSATSQLVALGSEMARTGAQEQP